MVIPIEKGIYNRFFGSFEHLKKLSKLKVLHVANTDVDSGWEHLSPSLEEIYCSSRLMPKSKVKNIEEQIKKDVYFDEDIDKLKGNYKRNWKIIHKDFTNVLQKLWENYRFSRQKTQEWIGAGLVPHNIDLANYLKKEGHTPQSYAEFKSKNAQEWLNHFYPIEKREKITEINIMAKDLEGNINLNDFVNLKSLRCGNNKIIQLNIRNQYW
ncbi:MAG: hypothetical protein LBR43_01695 [Spiroplasmataceae bacterium]|nr:hypothetical protein [Spiroplasmataceae bacterium]